MNYKEQILNYIAQNDVFKQHYEQLNDEQKKKIDEVLSGFIDNFSINIIDMISNLDKNNNDKP